MKVVLVHYGELALKGHNRRRFEKILVKNIKLSLGKPALKQVKRLEGRIVIFLNRYNKKTEEMINDKLSKVFGISWFSFAEVCKSDMKKIKPVVIKASKGKIKGKTFRIETKRAYKRFPLTSIETNEILGGVIINKYRSKVSLENPDITIHVEITKDTSFIYVDKLRGPRGLPVGSGGRVLVLLSGGIDSAVASQLIMKRGFSVDYLHIYALRNEKEVKNSKVYEIFEKMKEFNVRSKLYLIPYHEFDVKLQKADQKYHLILFKRFMFKLAEKLAKDIGLKAIVTGDNIAQVASQTLESIEVSDYGIKMSIFRPLLTYDKEEIINLAKIIETYELSIMNYKDCCSIVSKHPTTKPKLDKVEFYENKIKVNSIIKKCMKNLSVIQ